ncbi:MAG: hypothetical protein LBU20_01690 [Candidatus Nomurabacteria bacterium]|jgi:hypothetical protein|nr:hypothetical protein [Candidatus Nomurabacteria bacterium]
MKMSELPRTREEVLAKEINGVDGYTTSSGEKRHEKFDELSNWGKSLAREVDERAAYGAERAEKQAEFARNKVERLQEAKRNGVTTETLFVSGQTVDIDRVIEMWQRNANERQQTANGLKTGNWTA